MSEYSTDRIVVMARGLGTRMRKSDEAVSLGADQATAADSGVKALIPIGRPFLDHVLTVAADAGYKRVCLVIGPEHIALRNYYSQLGEGRLRFDFAIQEFPLGTANAVAAAEQWAEGEPFALINSDNFYPAVALRALRSMGSPGVAVFDRQAMLKGSNIPPDRIKNFAIAEIKQDALTRIIEKPSSADIEDRLNKDNGRLYLSMNLWLFDTQIFDACRAIPKSARGEYEITDAVEYSIQKLGARFSVARIEAPVLDLSSRADIGPVTQKLKAMEVRL